MIRFVRASLAACGAFWDTLIPASCEGAASPGVVADARTDHAAPTPGHSTPAAPSAVEDDPAAVCPPVPAAGSINWAADQEMNRQLAAAGFGPDVVEPPLWDFGSDHGRLVSCPGCGGQIRINGDDSEPYHTATGFIGCESNIFRTK